jgi:hypothetical protein
MSMRILLHSRHSNRASALLHRRQPSYRLRYTRSLEAPFPQEHFLIARRLEHPGNPEKQGATGRRPAYAPLRLQLGQSVLARRNHHLVSETADQRSGKKHGHDSGGPAQTCDNPGTSKMQHASGRCNPMKSSVDGSPGQDYNLTCVCEPIYRTYRQRTLPLTK